MMADVIFTVICTWTQLRYNILWWQIYMKYVHVSIIFAKLIICEDLYYIKTRARFHIIHEICLPALFWYGFVCRNSLHIITITTNIRQIHIFCRIFIN